jgi:hypothetical protein
VASVSKHIVYITRSSLLPPVHGAKALRVKEPLKNLRSPLAQRILKALFDPSAETVQRNTKSRDSNLRHPTLSLKMVLLTLCSFGDSFSQHQRAKNTLTARKSRRQSSQFFRQVLQLAA